MFSRIQLLCLAIAAVSTLAQTTLPADCARNYTVRLGDTCDEISANLHSSTYQLSHVNTNIDAACDNLAEGEPLCLGITGQDCTDTYVVQSGDNCIAIAQSEGTTDALILQNNPNVDSLCSNIYAGEVLCVTNVAIPYSN
ncbi:hypothetical protein PHLGIDRAFT_424268 [Phlebiopsis gigantea 11061_1 CR5-6]|uniref:LysM domain-containing protein n=1 Tax=Phlebiopsis gigantea (strain 11061_1 CR5-6) TaxID=745531 RepID=A0A0C3SAU9_PHLG1|nr:hypothetical protein PHLGIDRAFT_424268 [Phlebiopsis gigantea 11061_1 CR5-6]